ncbi:MAG: BPTI/Kunitz domain-containing protein [Leptospira sp.]|nr:BPTI/Kunitz domain-containing protein [Leptospira sp.]
MTKIVERFKLVLILSIVMSFSYSCTLVDKFKNSSKLNNSPKISAENCGLKPDPGPCRARMEGFYFDQKSKTCKTFIYGGCQGSLPFKTMEDCESTCK